MAEPQVVVSDLLQTNWVLESPAKTDIFWPTSTIEALEFRDSSKNIMVACYSGGSGAIRSSGQQVWVIEDYVTVDIVVRVTGTLGEARTIRENVEDEVNRIIHDNGTSVEGLILAIGIAKPERVEARDRIRLTITISCWSILGTDKAILFIPNATIKIGETTIASARNVLARWGNEIRSGILVGTDIPDQWTGPFSGEIDLEYVYVTDINLATLVDPGADGQIPETTITEDLKDTRSTPKTDAWTFKARLNQPSIIGRLGDHVIARVTGILTGRPTRSQA